MITMIVMVVLSAGVVVLAALLKKVFSRLAKLELAFSNLPTPVKVDERAIVKQALEAFFARPGVWEKALDQVCAPLGCYPKTIVDHLLRRWLTPEFWRAEFASESRIQEQLQNHWVFGRATDQKLARLKAMGYEIVMEPNLEAVRPLLEAIDRGMIKAHRLPVYIYRGQGWYDRWDYGARWARAVEEEDIPKNQALGEFTICEPKVYILLK